MCAKLSTTKGNERITDKVSHESVDGAKKIGNDRGNELKLKRVDRIAN